MSSPREEVLTVFSGDRPDRVPFTIWENKIPSPQMKQRLLELGTRIIVKSSVWHLDVDGVQIRQDDVPPTPEGHRRVRTTYRTPAGARLRPYACRRRLYWERLRYRLWCGPWRRLTCQDNPKHGGGCASASSAAAIENRHASHRDRHAS